MKRKELIYAIVMLLAILPITAVKIFDIHSDAKFHELYPNDEERAHREAAAAMEDCPFCHIQLSQFVVADECTLPQVTCVLLDEYDYFSANVTKTYRHYDYLRAPPTFSL
ncbi:MAG: hypothetical protein IKM10_04310 [Bacteroidaceae bacterium]|nr:hypothetical protein [Bacteroidaceae bacterium]